MKRLTTLTCALLMSPIVLGGGSFELIWQDEFDDLFLNPDNWEPMIGNGQAYGVPGWGNNEIQYYTGRPANVSTINGVLFITAQRENFEGYSFTSARIRSKDRFAFQYGMVEARIRLPVGEGLWPAFWMLPEENVYGGWPFSGEIDIMENFDNPNLISGALHFTTTGGGHTYITQGRAGSWGNSWHVYSVIWEPSQIRWFVDGVNFLTINSNQWQTSAAPGDADAPFDQPFHLLLNVAIGGNVQTPGPTAPFPRSMEVDWVRVYQAAQAPFFGVPHAVPGRIQAEDFDDGCEGLAYSDTDPTNTGGAYRPTSGVDLEACSEGGFNVGWIRPGEWIEYTVDIAQAGTYRVDARVASQSSGGSFRLLVDGQPAGQSFAFPATGGWQAWTTRSIEADLPAGEAVLRFENLGGENEHFNLNWLDFAFLGSDCPVDLAPPLGVLDLADVSAFSSGFITQDPIADLAEPFGVFDLADISAFTGGFIVGCP